MVHTGDALLRQILPVLVIMSYMSVHALNLACLLRQEPPPYKQLALERQKKGKRSSEAEACGNMVNIEP